MEGSIIPPSSDAAKFGDFIAGRSRAAAGTEMPTAPGGPFRELWSLGYRSLVPIIPAGAPLSDQSMLFKRLQAGKDSRGKTPGLRREDGAWSGFPNWQMHRTTEADLDRWHDMGAGVGLRNDGEFLILDVDAYGAAEADMIEAEALRILGSAPIRVGQEPKRALLYRAETPIASSFLSFQGPRSESDRVELLGVGKQVVMHGLHAKTGQPYRWVRPLVPFDELTTVSEEQVAELFSILRERLPQAALTQAALPTDRSEVDQGPLAAPDVELFAKAVRALPNTADVAPGYDDWIRIGQAIHAATIADPELGRELWQEWSERWEDYSEADADAAWRSFRAPHSVGAGFIFDLAHRHSGGAFGVAEQWFEEPQGNQEPLFAIERPMRRRFEFEDFNTAADRAIAASAPPLIKGLLDQGAFSVMYGDSNAGKTFVAMDLAFHIATGRPYAGMRTARMPIVYLATEGGGGVRKRVAALRDRYPLELEEVWFHLLPSSVDLLHPDADLAPLIEAIGALPQKPGLIVIDTLSRALAGGDENASTDMGCLVRNLDALRAATFAHLMVVHHSGKDRAKGARGHSLLRAALDTELEVADGAIRAVKQRDLDMAWSTRFHLEPRVLGVDQDGDPITSCTVTLATTADTATGDWEEIALQEIKAGEWRKDVQARDAWVGVPIAGALGLDPDFAEDRARLRTIITEWIKAGRLVVERRPDAKRRLRAFVTTPFSVLD